MLNELNIRELYKKGDWRNILNLFENGFHEPSILWLKPSRESLKFIVKHLTSRGVNRVVSLGCGTGLFEWLLSSFASAQKLDVIGVEVDKTWWTSKYAPQTFIPLEYVKNDEEQEAIINCKANTALLFCYFNCEEAWKSYLNNFTGSLVIVCGPIEGSGHHSNPQPFQPLTPEWTIVDGYRIRNSQDFIAIYEKI